MDRDPSIGGGPLLTFWCPGAQERPGYGRGVRCPACSGMKDKVVDSRTADDGAAIRRRRECLACSRRFTTYERVEEVPLMVVKRSGLRQAFERTKVVRGLLAAAKNRPVDRSQLESVATEVEELLRMEGHEHPSSRVGELVLGRLRHRDEVASIRFASVPTVQASTRRLLSTGGGRLVRPLSPSATSIDPQRRIPRVTSSARGC